MRFDLDQLTTVLNGWTPCRCNKGYAMLRTSDKAVLQLDTDKHANAVVLEVLASKEALTADVCDLASEIERRSTVLGRPLPS